MVGHRCPDTVSRHPHNALIVSDRVAELHCVPWKSPKCRLRALISTVAAGLATRSGTKPLIGR
jgi:hypothetical protein